jgi:hypothetical protein
VTAAVMDGGRRMFWTLSSSNRIGCVAVCETGPAGLPMTGGLLHFPVLLMAAPVLAGPGVSTLVERTCSGIGVTWSKRTAGPLRMIAAGFDCRAAASAHGPRRSRAACAVAWRARSFR